jgi:prepilin-type N-terminal cleavage/methylation domain-containing protein
MPVTYPTQSSSCVSLASPPKRYARTGFSLVELAVVLVVIGLLVGAIAGGTSLLRQSELQSVISDYGKYIGSVDKFNAQYGGLPGDLIDATSFWGDTADCNDAQDIGSPGTCNGDGNGNMAEDLATARREYYRAWQHLTLAGYLDGTYSGMAGGGGATHSVVGTNVPRGRIANSGWSIAYYDGAVSADYFSEVIRNHLIFGAPVTSSTTRGAALTPSEAMQIDSKADDGLPGVGRVTARESLTNCVGSGASDRDATYTRTNKGKECALHMSLTSR